MLYESPTAQQLKELQAKLDLKGHEMAALFGLKSARRWRECISEKDPQGLSPASAFFGAAKQVLTPKEIERVLAKMRELGATIDLYAEPEQPEQDGEQQP